MLCCLQVQKEKLHAELKQVLSQKRSHLRESTCQLAQPEMDSEPTDEQTVSRSLTDTVNVTFQAEIFIAFEVDLEIIVYPLFWLHKALILMLKEMDDDAHKSQDSLFPLWVVYKFISLVSHWKSGCNPTTEWPFLHDSLMDKMDSEVKCEATNNCIVNSALTQASETRYKTELKPKVHWKQFCIHPVKYKREEHSVSYVMDVLKAAECNFAHWWHLNGFDR